MKVILRGKVLGQAGISISNLFVELWKVDEQENIVGNIPLLKSITRADGNFNLDLNQLQNELPTKSIVLFRNNNAEEIGRVDVTTAFIDGKEILFEDTDLTPNKPLGLWPKPYLPLKQIPIEVVGQLKPNHEDGLILERAPQVIQFSSYVYLWPSPFGINTEKPQIDPPPLAQPFLLGVQVNYRQEWQLVGHALGELLHSLPLAPGEEASIEVLTWDRNIYKQEEEITSDLQREVEANRQYKDSREVIREVRETTNWYVSGQGKVNVFEIFSVEADPGKYQKETQNIDKDTRSTIVDTTDRAVTKFHNERKTLISSTREFGREEKVTRKLTNTNRSRSVTYHFYEVLRNYKILTSLASPAARPCIFIKQEPPYSIEILHTVEPTDDDFLDVLRWLYWNNHIIARGLLDNSLAEGLQVLPDLIAFWGVSKLTTDIDEQLISAAQEVVSAIESVENPTEPDIGSKRDVQSLIHDPLNSPIVWIPTEVLYGDSQLGLTSLRCALQNAGEGRLRTVVERFLKHWNDPRSGYQAVDPRVRESLEMPQHRPYLIGPVLYLYQFYYEVVGPDFRQELKDASLETQKNIGKAMRLIRHVADNYLYYFQLIWSAKNPMQYYLELKDTLLPGFSDVYVSDLFDPDLIGIYADYAVFPYKRADIESALGKLVQNFLDMENLPPWQSEVVLPSNGVIVEPQLGQYTACEPFIEQHRIYDLRLKEIEVEKARLENERRRKKIDVCELENPECCPSPKSGFLSRLACWLRRRRKGGSYHGE